MKNRNTFIFITILSTVACILVVWRFIIVPRLSQNAPNQSLGPLPSPTLVQYPQNTDLVVQIAIPNQDFQNLPKTLSVYRYLPALINQDELTRLTNILDYKATLKKITNPQSTIYYEALASDSQLRVYDSGFLSYKFYTNSDPTLKSPTSLPSPEQAITKTKDLFTKLNPHTNDLTFSATTTYFVINPSEYDLVDKPEGADGILVTLTPTINKLPLKNPDPNQDIITARVGTNSRLLEINTPLFSLETSQSGTYPLKNSDQIKQDLQNKQGVLVSLENSVVTPGSLLDIPLQSIIINKLELAYLDDQTNHLFQPIYVLLGTITTQSGQTTTGILYLPAVVNPVPSGTGATPAP